MKRLKQVDGSLVKTEKSLTVELELPNDLLWFQGHFPKKAILPGVAQIEWVLHYAKIWIGDFTLAEMSAVKFVCPVIPGDRLRLVLTKKEQVTCVVLKFCYELILDSSESKVASIGQMRLGL